MIGLSRVQGGSRLLGHRHRHSHRYGKSLRQCSVEEPRGEVDMRISSAVFENEGVIPSEYTCDGRDISPPLRFEEVPEGTVSLALIMDDPDAPLGTFDHWMVWNIPPSATSIQEGKAPEGVQGKNDFGRNGYGGPCPPRGVHRYLFKLYALDAKLDLPEGSRKKALEKAIQGHIVEHATLTARYSRSA